MNEIEFCALIRESLQQPFRACVGDRRHCTVAHPDFALVADGTLALGSAPGRDLRGIGFVLAPLKHIPRIEVSKRKSRAAA